MRKFYQIVFVLITIRTIAQQTPAKEETKPTPEGEVSTTQQSVKINGVVAALS